MSRSREELEQDVRQAVAQMDGLKSDAKQKLLMALVEKHVVLNESELSLTKHDFDTMLGLAKMKYVKESLPIVISGKSLLPQESTNLMLVEATIEVLNSKNALKRLPKFERKDNG